MYVGIMLFLRSQIFTCGGKTYFILWTLARSTVFAPEINYHIKNHGETINLLTYNPTSGITNIFDCMLRPV